MPLPARKLRRAIGGDSDGEKCGMNWRTGVASTSQFTLTSGQRGEILATGRSYGRGDLRGPAVVAVRHDDDAEAGGGVDGEHGLGFGLRTAVAEELAEFFRVWDE